VPIDKNFYQLSIRILIDKPFSRVLVTIQLLIRQPSYKLLTGTDKDNLDMMFTKLIIHEDLPLTLGESTYFHDFMLEVSKGSYKGACADTVRGLVSVLSDLGQKQCRLFVSTWTQLERDQLCLDLKTKG
jgi:hypothetical protein